MEIKYEYIQILCNSAIIVLKEYLAEFW
jgi:hypothetical protein